MSGKERKIYLMGVDSHGLSAETQQLADQAALIVGGKRLLALLPADCRVACQAVTPLAAACAAMGLALAQGDVVVLASGDPLFFGIGRRLLAEFGQDTVVIGPPCPPCRRPQPSLACRGMMRHCSVYMAGVTIICPACCCAIPRPFSLRISIIAPRPWPPNCWLI